MSVIETPVAMSISDISMAASCVSMNAILEEVIVGGRNCELLYSLDDGSNLNTFVRKVVIPLA